MSASPINPQPVLGPLTNTELRASPVSVSGIIATTTTPINVAASASSVLLVGANPGRLGVILDNNSSSACYIAYGATAGKIAGSYTVRLLAGARWEMPAPIWRGSLAIIWDTATGFATGGDLS